MNRNRLRPLLLLGLVALAGAFVSPLSPAPPQEARASTLLRWGYYVYYDQDSLVSFRANVSQLDIVSPYFYHLTPSGTIKTQGDPATNQEVLDIARANGLKVLPLIQNESKWDDFRTTIETPEKQAAIVQLLVDLVGENGYDGIHIDFEAVNADDADLLTEFMRLLSDEFHTRNWIVSQAVIARFGDRPSVWGGAYDYAELAKLNDYIVIMAYDLTPSGSETPGPVASASAVDDVLAYAVTKIPRQKLFLGVPFYGYDWNLTEGPPATGVGYQKVMELSQRPGATGGYSPSDESPWLRYTDDNGHPHEVWYENSYSLEAKLNLALEYEVAGFAAWRIGHEDPDNWRVIANLQTPATRAEPGPESETAWYFEETGHWLRDEFLSYWLQNGGLARFGYPKTETFVEYDPMVGQSYEVQYFERARFEHHPEFAGTEFEVLLGHIGRWALDRRGPGPSSSPATPVEEGRFFPESGHNLAEPFLTYWETYGGLMAYGYPITEPVMEVNPEDGRTYLVQYFERARFEHHPEFAGTQHEVLLGLLGNEMLRERGWIR
jgi:spore germination protein YaaH